MDSGWHQDSIISFQFDITDVNASYDISYKIRNNADYQYYNLYMQYFIIDGSGKTIKSSVQEVNLMDSKSGKPFGKGFSDTYQHSFTALENYKFKEEGSYKVLIGQYMRVENLDGILSLGLSLKKSLK